MEVEASDLKLLGGTEGVETLIKKEMGRLRIEDVPTVLFNVDMEELEYITELRQLGEEYDATALIGVRCCHRCKSHDDISYRGNGKTTNPMCGQCFMKQEGDRLRNYRATSYDDQLYYKRHYDLDVQLAYTQGGCGRSSDVTTIIVDNDTPSHSAGWIRNKGITRKNKVTVERKVEPKRPELKMLRITNHENGSVVTNKFYRRSTGESASTMQIHRVITKRKFGKFDTLEAYQDDLNETAEFEAYLVRNPDQR